MSRNGQLFVLIWITRVQIYNFYPCLLTTKHFFLNLFASGVTKTTHFGDYKPLKLHNLVDIQLEFARY